MKESVDRFVEAKAPVNIAVIKYWGKRDGKLKIPLNDSLSGTLNMDDMCTTTSVQIARQFERDQLFLNGKEEELSDGSPARQMLKTIRSMTPLKDLLNYHARIVSDNNFPTAAGLASSAAGYACLAYALGHAYGIKDEMTLSRIARNGSGSACRSLFGGFVHWVRGNDHESSVAHQVVDEAHWPEMRVVICVVNDSKKEVSSSLGMAQSVKTSTLMQHRADVVVPKRIDEIKTAIINKNFESFAEITMQDSNQFHAICLDTYPPIFYLNETSRQVMKICHLINSFMGKNKLAYTFDAGPNACIYLLEDFVPTFIEIVRHFFPCDQHDSNAQSPPPLLEVKGQPCPRLTSSDSEPIIKHLLKFNVECLPNSIKYLINTSIGGGPKVTQSRC